MNVAMLALALCSLSTLASADEAPAAPAVEHYTYGMTLDVAQVLAIDPAPHTCSVVPLHMTYLDSHQRTHVLEYMAMGNGCDNG